MLIRRLIYVLLIIFCIWLALATRLHADWFWPFIAKYGGDTIWSAQFLFLLRIIFIHTSLLKLAFINYILGVLVEVSQLYHAPWINNIRSTVIGEALLGLGFLWSDLVCYAAGTLISYFVCVLVDRYTA
jgi:hypothetical protein